MRPTKLLTISAIAGLSLISYGRSAHAVPVSLTGSVSSSCTLAATDSPGLSEVNDPPTQLVATSNGVGGKVIVTCNDANKSLDLTISSSSQVQNGIPSIKFVGATGPTGGIFNTLTSANTTYKLTANPTIVALPAPTKPLGDTGYIWAKIDAPSGKLLKAGEYNLVVNARITP